MPRVEDISTPRLLLLQRMEGDACMNTRETDTANVSIPMAAVKGITTVPRVHQHTGGSGTYYYPR